MERDSVQSSLLVDPRSQFRNVKDVLSEHVVDDQVPGLLEVAQH